MKTHTQSVNILIQQAHPDMRELLKLVLGREGYRVLTATTAQQALSTLKKYKPRLAITEVADKKVLNLFNAYARSLHFKVLGCLCEYNISSTFIHLCKPGSFVHSPRIGDPFEDSRIS